MAVFGSLFDPNRRRPNLTRTTFTGRRGSSGSAAGGQGQQDFLMDFYRQVQEQQTSARAANEQRFQNAIQIADEDFARKSSGLQTEEALISQESGQRAADIRSQTERQVSDFQQGQARRGLSNVANPSLVAGIRGEGQSNLNRLSDALLGRRLGVRRRITEQDRSTQLGLLERRQDIGPDQAGMLDLVKTIGQGFGTGAR